MGENTMTSRTDVILQSARTAIETARTAQELEEIRVRVLGRKGELTAVLRSVKELSPEERRSAGQAANAARIAIQELLEGRIRELATEHSISDIDLTLPGTRIPTGHLHPLSIVSESIQRIFQSMNFSVVAGQEIENEYYNFDALNIPAHHPAREMWDTFWIKQSGKPGAKQRLLLRTHTSPMQVRYMERHTPPFQIIVPGRVFRYEATDASHEINFYQVEGLMVGRHVTLANLKYVIEEFFKRFFGRNVAVRFRPGYFPFTEPSIEVDIKMGGKWLEIMGAGMVHPRVFSYAHYDQREWQGFAFGMGLDRLAMVKYGIPDIRLFYSGDARFTRQFKRSA
jgi:phenylalanyl-tRNA synthetase alpha chain